MANWAQSNLAHDFFTTSRRNLNHNDTKFSITQFITQARFYGLKYSFIFIFGEPGFLLIRDFKVYIGFTSNHYYSSH